ncbi:MAG: 2-oxoacid:acceptor oxidoreductase subunit alpha [Candidatus Gracilibacteria bacterium]|jgi:2-oxoglutarate ferredoxin oxidoreductase subunit alpha
MDFTWKIGGEAGAGIMTTGTMFSRACMRSGAYTFDYSEYPSLIRGGHNTFQTRVADRPVKSQVKTVNLLVALNQNAIALHKNELAKDAGIVFDPENVNVDDLPEGLNLFPIPLTAIVNQYKGEKIMRNMVALSASLALIGVDFSIIQDLIKESFGKKNPDIVKHNLNNAKAGYEFMKDKESSCKISRATKNKMISISGNESIAMGAVKSGCRFVSTYPMTPSTAIMHFFAKHSEKMGLIMKHTEDEIAGILMAIGASHAGVRSMAATSGGGFSLMVEALGLAAMTETPLVLTVASRPGPATGLPTWTEQSDLRFVMHAAQGDFPRVILAPGDIEESFEAGLQAFNYAEKYQIPAIILTDKFLGESYQSVPPFKTPKGWKIDRGQIAQITSSYKRYEITEDGVSPRAFAGDAIFGAFSNEHNCDGDFTEDAEMRTKMAEKRQKKQIVVKDRVRIYGDDEADVTVFSWGSTKGPVLEAMELAKKEGIKIKLVHTFCVLPFPTEDIARELASAKKAVIIEGNIGAQFAGVVREFTGVEVKHKYLKYDGRPFYPEDILKFIQNV